MGLTTCACKSTIGRTYERPARPFVLRSRDSVARPWSSFRVLNAVLAWVHDPLTVRDLEGWSLDEEEVRADLEHGRD